MHPITVYSSNWCGFCRAAKALLKERGLEFHEIDVTADPNRKMEMMERSGRRTVPQIFFGDEHIGGYTDLRDYFEEQEL
ncbi:glutaredoxin 3 [Gilvimarinus sp. F26214L]|uniref:glutaredoxin 3 n=1 Tax=Gilvimarinus sp. DZF01 TaxID=3461371 RepID=UPI0040461552